jgi:hypothetical protein
MIAAWLLQAPEVDMFLHCSMVQDLARILCHLYEDQLRPVIQHIPGPGEWTKAQSSYTIVTQWYHLLSPKANQISLDVNLNKNGNADAGFRMSVMYWTQFAEYATVTDTTGSTTIDLTELRRGLPDEYCVVTCKIYLKDDMEVEKVSAWESIAS